MKKILLKMVIFSVLVGVCLFVGEDKMVMAACKTSGSYTYCATSVSSLSTTRPIYNSQAKHTNGYSTTVGVTKSQTDTVTASTSLNWGINAWGATVTTSVGVSASVSKTSSTSIKYTIAKGTATGYYRINHVFPGNAIRLTQAKLPEYSIVATKTIAYAPKTNAAYHTLVKYA